MGLLRSVVSAAAVIGAGLVVSAPAEARVIDRHGSGPSSYGDVTAWSRYLPAANRWVLMVRRAGGTRRVDVPSSDRSFGVDVGPDSRGGESLVYSRCIRRSAQRCDPDVFRVDLRDGGVERRQAASRAGVFEASPAVWGDRVVWITETPDDDIGEVVVVVDRGRRIARRLRGSVLDDGDVGPTGRPVTVDVRGSRVLFRWNAGMGGCEQDGSLPNERDELWLAGQTSTRRIYAGCPISKFHLSPVARTVRLSARHTWAVGYKDGEPQQHGQSVVRLLRFDLQTRSIRSAIAPMKLRLFDIQDSALLYSGRGIGVRSEAIGPVQ